MNSLTPDRPNRISQLIRELQREVRRNKLLKSASVLVNPTEAGTVIEVIRKGGGASTPSAAQAFRIKTILPDYLICNRVEFSGVTPAVDSEDVNVARNYKLRKTPFDGKTIGGVTYAYATSGTDGTQGRARLATSSGVVEAQTIVPAYTNYTGGTYVGDIIYADENPLGGTGVLASNGDDVTWLDQNRDGRAWAEAFN